MIKPCLGLLLCFSCYSKSLLQLHSRSEFACQGQIASSQWGSRNQHTQHKCHRRGPEISGQRFLKERVPGRMGQGTTFHHSTVKGFRRTLLWLGLHSNVLVRKVIYEGAVEAQGLQQRIHFLQAAAADMCRRAGTSKPLAPLFTLFSKTSTCS